MATEISEGNLGLCTFLLSIQLLAVNTTMGVFPTTPISYQRQLKISGLHGGIQQ